jgi:fumarylacetoacetase
VVVFDRSLDLNGRSWVNSANDPESGFPLQSLPYCAVYVSDAVHLGVGIGCSILDLHRLSAEGYLDALEPALRAACLQPTLNALMEAGPDVWRQLRVTLTACLSAGVSTAQRDALEQLLVPAESARFELPVRVADYTDFYASIDHATNVGSLFRPDEPLLPNYKYVPIGYHGRASSLVVSGTPIRRPCGQVKPAAASAPIFRASAQLDYEVEVAAYVGQGNRLGTPISIQTAEQHIFGYSLMNDWSARDIQAWEYQPLGPFLGKNFGTSLSPWVVPAEALLPYRVHRAPRGAGDPEPLAYLDDTACRPLPGIDLTVEVYVSTAYMREQHIAPQRLSTGNLRALYWSFAQMVAHHTAGGCNLNVGDLLGSGTISGSTPGSEGSLLEITRRGQLAVQLPGGESRTFLEDGDEVILRGFSRRAGLPHINFGECRGRVESAIVLP